MLTNLNLNKNSKNREKNKIFKALKGEKKDQPRIPYAVKLSFKNKGEIKTFSDKQKRKEFTTMILTL